MYRNDDVEQLFPFYALDAVTEQERELVENYVSSNPDARVRLEEELALASELALSVQPVSPPPHIKQKVLAHAANRPKQTAVSNNKASVAPKSIAPAGPTFWQRLQQSFVSPLLTGTAVGLVALLLIWNLNLQRVIDALQVEIAVLQSEADEQDAILAILPESSNIPVQGTEAAPDGVASLYLAQNGTDAVLVVSNLSTLPPDRVYQLWYIGDQGPVDRGTFEVDENGQAYFVVKSDTAIQNFSAIGVSIEPQGGSDQPTGDIVLLGDTSISGNDT